MRTRVAPWAVSWLLLGTAVSPALAAESTEAPAPQPAPQPKSDESVPEEPITRRGGFTLGASLGLFGMGNAHGYPDDLNYIGDANYRASVSWRSSSFDLWLGGALTDWFTFGFGIENTAITGSKLHAGVSGFVFRVETFPLFSQGGIYRDLGLFALFGTGSGHIRQKSDEAEFAKAGSLSSAGVGVFWEPWRLGHGHLNFGPFAAYEYQSADSMTQQFGVVGIRGALYLKP